jgi:site-specific recombinase XerD
VSGYRLVSTPSLQWRFQIVRPDGLPEFGLTLFANDLMKSLSESSVPIYMREILALANWALVDSTVLKQGWHLFGPPQEVRNLLREYLTVATHCKLSSRADLAGLKVTYVNATAGTRVNVRILLSALKRLYEFLITRGLYSHQNPMIHEDAGKLRAELWEKYRQAVRAIRGRNPMPAVSGVDERSGIRLSENYFRCVEREWIPRTIDDRDFPHLVYAAGKRFGWGLRELCVARTLFESGARISEVVGLTALDWSRSSFRNLLHACNKGSHGLRTKTLVISNPTLRLYRRYFDDDADGRCAHDPKRLRVSDLATMLRKDPKILAQTPLFLTERGTPLSARLFRDQYWKPALEAAGMDADPHQSRHWFVTNALRNIDRMAKDPSDLTRRRQELIQYMSWSSGERTLQAYDHVQRAADFRVHLQAVHKEMRRRERTAGKNPGMAPRNQRPGMTPVSEVARKDLAFLLGEDDDD